MTYPDCKNCFHFDERKGLFGQTDEICLMPGTLFDDENFKIDDPAANRLSSAGVDIGTCGQEARFFEPLLQIKPLRRAA